MFGQITAANSMKRDATEPEQGVFTFTQGDQIAALATNEGRLLRGGLRCGCGARRCVTERVDIPRAQLRMASAATELGHVGNIHRRRVDFHHRDALRHARRTLQRQSVGLTSSVERLTLPDHSPVVCFVIAVECVLHDTNR